MLSAIECAAAQDVLQVCGALSAEDNANAKILLDRIAAMLTKLDGRGYFVHEQPEGYEVDPIDDDTESGSEV